MGLLAVITSSEQTIAVTIPVKLQSIFFHNNDAGSNSRVRILTGGSSGTAKFDSLIDDFSTTGTHHVSHRWSEEGGSLPEGMYIEITGTLSVNIEYKPMAVAGA